MDNKQIILGYEGEVALKGQNRRMFEDAIAKNLKHRLSSIGDFEITRSQSAFFISPKSDVDMARAKNIVQNTFGLAAVSTAYISRCDFDEVKSAVITLFSSLLVLAKSFKVRAKRADKSYPLNSMQIASELGAVILDRFAHLSVDVITPDVTVFVEIRDGSAYLHTGKETAVGGMPVGTSGRALLLLSGGIDSPVAAYMAAKRGLQLSAVHFATPPYTGVRAQQKVESLSQQVSQYTGPLALFTVPFTKIGEMLKADAPEPLHTIIMRRSMVRIADIVAQRDNCEALVTGECLAQVASQTLKAMICTDNASRHPILRPLVCLDKIEITEIARRIGTFETSILPYEDCCTLFTPPHPKTRPTVSEVCDAETDLPLKQLENEAAEGAILTIFNWRSNI